MTTTGIIAATLHRRRERTNAHRALYLWLAEPFRRNANGSRADLVAGITTGHGCSLVNPDSGLVAHYVHGHQRTEQVDSLIRDGIVERPEFGPGGWAVLYPRRAVGII